MKFSTRLWVISVTALLVLGVVITMAPYVYMISSTFKRNTEIFAIPFTLWPRKPTMLGIIKLFEEFPFGRWFVNSIFMASTRTAISIFLSALAGFAFAKYYFKFKNVLFVFVIATALIPIQAVLIPLFIEMVTFRWINTYWAIIVPFAVTAFYIFLMRQYMLAVPSELIDAARIDGAGEFRIFWQVAMPIMKPAVAVVGILSFTGAWNDYLWPLIVLQSEELYTTNLGVATMVGPYKVEYGTIMAGSFLGTLPIIIAFFLMQRQFIAGLTAGALKL
jgi:ABC-type glycerol-3-phosphate transport system permease component